MPTDSTTPPPDPPRDLMDSGDTDNDKDWKKITIIGNSKLPPVTLEEAANLEPDDDTPTHYGGLDDGELSGENKEPDDGQ